MRKIAAVDLDVLKQTTYWGAVQRYRTAILEALEGWTQIESPNGWRLGTDRGDQPGPRERTIYGPDGELRGTMFTTEDAKLVIRALTALAEKERPLIPMSREVAPDHTGTGYELMERARASAQYRRDDIFMCIYFSDSDPTVECQCKWRHVGDSLNDAVLAWTKHVTEAHRDDW